MRIHRHRRFQRQAELERKLIHVNERIRVPEVRVIDEQGESIDVMPTERAIALARERGYDLIEVNPKAQPPICKLLDYKQFKYEQEKARRLQKAHAKKVEVKGVRLSLRIGEHDRDLRLKKASEFFDEGNRVAVEIILRGRERAYGATAREVIQKFVADLRTNYDLSIDQPLSVQGGRFSLVVGGKPKGSEGAAAQEDEEEELDSAEQDA